MKYYLDLVEAALPSHTALTLQDFDYVVRQGSAIEQQVQSGQIPPKDRRLFVTASERLGSMSPQQRQRAQRAFQDLDFNRTGMLSTHEQHQLILQMLKPSVILPSESLWLAIGLSWYGSKVGRGNLTFEEMLLALSNLARSGEQQAYHSNERSSPMRGTTDAAPPSYYQQPPTWQSSRSPYPTQAPGYYPYPQGLDHQHWGQHPYDPQLDSMRRASYNDPYMQRPP